jgi:hypothetical protein
MCSALGRDPIVSVPAMAGTFVTMEVYGRRSTPVLRPVYTHDVGCRDMKIHPAVGRIYRDGDEQQTWGDTVSNIYDRWPLCRGNWSNSSPSEPVGREPYHQFVPRSDDLPSSFERQERDRRDDECVRLGDRVSSMFLSASNPPTQTVPTKRTPTALQAAINSVFEDFSAAFESSTRCSNSSVTVLRRGQ